MATMASSREKTSKVSGPGHYGIGIPVTEETSSFQDRVYSHFRMGEELIKNFVPPDIKELFTHEYYKTHATDKMHHHISWILIGTNE